MHPDPLIQLIIDSLELMNRAFTPTRSSWGTMLEFYHQFRKLWDRGIPVGLGLGHLLLRTEARDDFDRDFDKRNPNLLFLDQLGEKGRLTEKLAMIEFTTVMSFSMDEPRTAQPLDDSSVTKLPGHYQHRVLVVVGSARDFEDFPVAAIPGVTLLAFVSDRWSVRVVKPVP